MTNPPGTPRGTASRTEDGRRQPGGPTPRRGKRGTRAGLLPTSSAPCHRRRVTAAPASTSAMAESYDPPVPFRDGRRTGPTPPRPLRAARRMVAAVQPPRRLLEEATFYATLLADGSQSRREVLELGSGGGNNAFHLCRHFDMTLVDLSPAMIEVSRALNPECEHVCRRHEDREARSAHSTPSSSTMPSCTSPPRRTCGPRWRPPAPTVPPAAWRCSCPTGPERASDHRQTTVGATERGRR